MKPFYIFILALILSQPVFASQNPRPLGADSRIRHVIFNPNEVYEIKATYGFQTAIEFSDQETIQIASIGDSIAWQVIPVQNRLFLKPVEQNPRTNLTVVTNKRTYYFHLMTVDVSQSSDMTYLVRFEYPQNSSVVTNTTSKFKHLSDYNLKYVIKNDAKKMGLVRALDNGEFTYLEFKDFNSLPAIFVLDENNQESLVNYRIEAQYVVIEQVAKQFVLRRGKTVGRLINKAKDSTNKQYSSKEVPHG